MVYKKILLIFTIILLSILLLSCSNQNTSNAGIKGNSTPSPAHNNPNKLTKEDVIKRYGDGKIINITEYYSSSTNSDYLLVEFLNEGDNQCFDWYSLKTGDRDIMPISMAVSPTNSKLQDIIFENRLLFVTDGVNNMNSHKYFPQIVECYKLQDTSGDGDFSATAKVLYLPLDQTVRMGAKSQENIADIKVSLTGVELLFEPMQGEESIFYAAYTTIPPFKTTYIKDKNQFIIEFTGTGISTSISSPNINEQNRYISSVKLEQSGRNTLITINLKDTAKYYTVKNSHIDPMIDDFPCAEFDFASQFKIE